MKNLFINRAIEELNNAVELCLLTQEDLSAIMDRPQSTISDIMNGKRLITPEWAIDFECALKGHIKADDLLSKQSEFCLQIARNQRNSSDIDLKSRINNEFPLSEMEKRGWIPKSSKAADTMRAVLEFANYSDNLDCIVDPFQLKVLARQSKTIGHLSPSGIANRAWQFRVRELAEMTPVRKFDHAKFVDKGLAEIRSLIKSLKGVSEVPQTLARYGIRLVIVEQLSKTKLEGAVMWLDGINREKPVIALTLRLGKIDSFWWNLGHELQHIKYLHDFTVNGLENDDPDELKHIEEEADRGASEWIVSEKRLLSFVERHNSRFSERNILAFSEIINVHPGLLVGMLQDKGYLTYSSKLNRFKLDIRDRILLSSMVDGFKRPVVKARNYNSNNIERRLI